MRVSTEYRRRLVAHVKCEWGWIRMAAAGRALTMRKHLWFWVVGWLLRIEFGSLCRWRWSLVLPFLSMLSLNGMAAKLPKHDNRSFWMFEWTDRLSWRRSCYHACKSYGSLREWHFQFLFSQSSLTFCNGDSHGRSRIETETIVQATRLLAFKCVW